LLTHILVYYLCLYSFIRIFILLISIFLFYQITKYIQKKIEFDFCKSKLYIHTIMSLNPANWYTDSSEKYYGDAETLSLLDDPNMTCIFLVKVSDDINTELLPQCVYGHCDESKNNLTFCIVKTVCSCATYTFCPSCLDQFLSTPSKKTIMNSCDVSDPDTIENLKNQASLHYETILNNEESYDLNFRILCVHHNLVAYGMNM